MMLESIITLHRHHFLYAIEDLREAFKLSIQILQRSNGEKCFAHNNASDGHHIEFAGPEH